MIVASKKMKKTYLLVLVLVLLCYTVYGINFGDFKKFVKKAGQGAKKHVAASWKESVNEGKDLMSGKTFKAIKNNPVAGISKLLKASATLNLAGLFSCHYSLYFSTDSLFRPKLEENSNC